MNLATTASSSHVHIHDAIWGALTGAFHFIQTGSMLTEQIPILSRAIAPNRVLDLTGTALMPANLLPVFDIRPPASDFRNDVLTGLRHAQKSVPHKYLYDPLGSDLFEKLLAAPEYYVPACEREIMDRELPTIASRTGSNRVVIEFGSGSSTKTKNFLSKLNDVKAYVPIEINVEQLSKAAQNIALQFVTILVAPVAADYSHEMRLPRYIEKLGYGRLGYFPGTTIGNMEPDVAAEFLTRCRELLGRSGSMVLSADLKKDPEVLERAYDDAAGYNAEFNLNLLRRINRDLGANFNLGQFAHSAHYANELSRVETRIVSLCDQRVTISEEEFAFREGEHIHTGSSYKFDLCTMSKLAERAGFRCVDHWTDRRKYFGVFLLEAVTRNPRSYFFSR